MHNNTRAINYLFKYASDKNEEEEDKNKKKKYRKYTSQEFEKKIGTDPVTVSFRKRTDGSKRVMHLTRDWDMLTENAEQFGFRPGSGVRPIYDYSNNGLSLVWDLDKNAYRMVNLNEIQRIKPYRYS